MKVRTSWHGPIPETRALQFLEQLLARRDRMSSNEEELIFKIDAWSYEKGGFPRLSRREWERFLDLCNRLNLLGRLPPSPPLRRQDLKRRWKQ